jgi:hypothetical protein
LSLIDRDLVTHLSKADVLEVTHQQIPNAAMKNITRKAMALLHTPDEHCPEVASGRLASSGTMAMHEQL